MTAPFATRLLLQASPLLERLRITGTLNRTLPGRALDLAQIIFREIETGCADVFFETMQLRRARNRNDPRPLREQPRQRNLRRRCTFAVGDYLQPVDE